MTNWDEVPDLIAMGEFYEELAGRVKGVIEFDREELWLVHSDLEGASEIVAMNVNPWFGELIEELLG